MPPAKIPSSCDTSSSELIGQTVVHIMQTLQLLTNMVNGIPPDVTTPRTLRSSIIGVTDHLHALTRQLDRHDESVITARLGHCERRRRSAAAAAARRSAAMRAALGDDDDSDPPDDDADATTQYMPLGGGRGPPPPPGAGGARTCQLRRVMDGSVVRVQRTIKK